jgi:lauroyl/myristoyl acyltransferase
VTVLYQLARAAMRGAGKTPRAVRHCVGGTISVGCYLRWPSMRLATQRNMAQVLGRAKVDSKARYLALASWYNYGRYASDFLHFPAFDVEEVVEGLRDLTQGTRITGWEYIDQARQAGRGVIITTAHFGNWDVAGAYFAYHIPLTAIAETFSDAQLNELIQGQRQQKGITIVPMEHSPRPTLRALQHNEAVALLVDRPVKPDEGVPVRFFGRTTYVPAGPAMLAIKSGAALVPGYVWYGHHHEWYGRFFPPIFPIIPTLSMPQHPPNAEKTALHSETSSSTTVETETSIGTDVPSLHPDRGSTTRTDVETAVSSPQADVSHSAPASRGVAKAAERAEVLRLMHEVFAALEVMVREWPTQWYMFRPFWGQEPQAEKV